MIVNFTQSDYLAIVIFILTAILTLSLYKWEKRTKFIFVEEIHIQLNNVDFQKIDKLKLLYQNEEITNYLFYLRGTLIMIGSADVHPSNIFHPITFKLDKSGIWKGAEVIDASELLESNLEIFDENMYMNTSIIKTNDFVSIEGYYNTKESGYKIFHRILNVKGKVQKIYEDHIFYYYMYISLSLMVISFTLIFSSKKNEGVTNNNQPSTIKSRTLSLSKEDSLMLSTHKYNELYVVKGDTLQNDSIFYKNYILNKQLNARLHKTRDSLIELRHTNKKTLFYKIDKARGILQSSKDSLFYEDWYSIGSKKDSLLKKLLRSNALIENQLYNLTDTIAVSFSLPKAYMADDKRNSIGDFILRLLPYLIYMVFSLILLYSLRNIYYIKSHSKTYSWKRKKNG